MCLAHLWAFAVVMCKSPFLHGEVGKAPAFQFHNAIKVSPAFLGSFTLQTLFPLAVTFCRVFVMPQMLLNLVEKGSLKKEEALEQFGGTYEELKEAASLANKN